MVRSPHEHITIRDIWEARNRIKPFVRKTPLIPATGLKEQTSSQIHLKLENLQKTHTFKIRGAANKILSLSEKQKELGVTTFSTGNHGLAVAFVAKVLGIRAVICVSRRVPTAKIESIRKLGAEILFCGNSQDDAESMCYHLQDEKGMTVVKPFDDPFVIAGQGTIGLEIMEQLPRVDTVMIPLSGGGLLSGVALALKTNDPNIRVIGVSMETSPVMYKSLKAGKPVVLEEQETLADSLLGGIGQNNRYTFQMVQKYADDVILIPEKDIAHGIAYMLREHRFIVEGAAATSIGALLDYRFNHEFQEAVALITGSNVDLDVILDIAHSHL